MKMYQRSEFGMRLIPWYLAVALFIALAVSACIDQLPNVARPFMIKTDLIADNWQLEQASFRDDSQSVLAYSVSGSVSFTMDCYDFNYAVTTIEDSDTVRWEKNESGCYVIGYDYQDTIAFAPDKGSFWGAWHTVWGSSLQLSVPTGGCWLDLTFEQPLDSPLVASGWDVRKVPFTSEILIADCRNDGKERIYGVHEGVLYEYLWENGTWLTVKVTYLSEPEPGYKLRGLTAASCRGDKRRRIYTATSSSDRINTITGVYESEFNNGAWHTTQIVSINSIRDWYIDGFASADLKGTGTESLLLHIKTCGPSSGPSVIYEISHENGTWIKRNMPLPDTLCCTTFTHTSIATFSTGTGDTTMRDQTPLYAAINLYDSSIIPPPDQRHSPWPLRTCVYRYLRQDGSTWNTSLVDSTIDVFNQGNVNLIMPIPGSDNTGGLWIAVGGIVYEYTFTGSSWTKTTAIHHGGDVQVLCIADIRRDGSTRMYLLSNTGLYEYTLQAGAWVKTSHISERFILNITAGKGQGGGLDRLYAGDWYRSHEIFPTGGR